MTRKALMLGPLRCAPMSVNEARWKLAVPEELLRRPPMNRQARRAIKKHRKYRDGAGGSARY